MTLILYFERRVGKSTAGQMMDVCLVLMVVVLRKREKTTLGELGLKKRKDTDVTCDTLESVSEKKMLLLCRRDPFCL